MAVIQVMYTLVSRGGGIMAAVCGQYVVNFITVTKIEKVANYSMWVFKIEGQNCFLC